MHSWADIASPTMGYGWLWVVGQHQATPKWGSYSHPNLPPSATVPSHILRDVLRLL